MSDRHSRTSDEAEKVWKLMDKIEFAMLATRAGETIRARPMGAYVREEDNAIYFLTDVNGVKDDEMQADPNVCLCFADKGGQKYVSVSGVGEVSNDRAKIKELWNIASKAWWPNEDDPRIRVLKITPHQAEYWDSPGGIVSTVLLTAAAIGGFRPETGEKGKVEL